MGFTVAKPSVVHVYPNTVPEHRTDADDPKTQIDLCWCNPDIEDVSEPGVPAFLILHRMDN